jgi:hypothetical protein
MANYHVSLEDYIQIQAVIQELENELVEATEYILTHEPTTQYPEWTNQN